MRKAMCISLVEQLITIVIFVVLSGDNGGHDIASNVLILGVAANVVIGGCQTTIVLHCQATNENKLYTKSMCISLVEQLLTIVILCGVVR